MPDVRDRLSRFVEPGLDALVFTGAKGAPLRRSNFQQHWRRALAASDAPAGLHFHDLRHTGNTWAETGATLRELMDRMGHSATRAALVYLHSRADRHRAIAAALSDLVANQRKNADDRPDEDGAAGVPVPA